MHIPQLRKMLILLTCWSGWRPTFVWKVFNKYNIGGKRQFMSRWQRNSSYQSSTFKNKSLCGKTKRNLVNINAAQKIFSIFWLLFPGVKIFYEDILIITKLHHSSAREINSISLGTLPLFSRSMAAAQRPGRAAFLALRHACHRKCPIW